MTEVLRYNLRLNGTVSEIGFISTYEYEMEANSPVDMGNSQWWYKREGEWIKFTEEEYAELYQLIED